ncbi:MAG: crosslink repair DNA glycosylase YcaQ family protein [Thermoleophilia bacterium]
MTPTLTPGQARRIAVAAQGLARPRPQAPTLAHARRVLGTVGVIQLDAVNVLARAHELLLWSRLGPHPRDLLRRLADHRDTAEMWVHEASIAAAGLYPLLAWRRAQSHPWDLLGAEPDAHAEAMARLEQLIRTGGGITAGQAGTRRTGPWWGWDDTKRVLEAMFWHGRLAVRRDAAFGRVYDLPDRLLPPDVLATPPPAPDAARTELLALAGGALGVATAADLADYHRIPLRDARGALASLVRTGVLREVRVRGWREPAYLHHEVRIPRRVRAAALVSPFDSLVWFRPRVERLFGMRYRLEIYVPKPRRVHGYYVLPFLLGDALVARVDLKAHRAAGMLGVQAAHLEAGARAGEVAPALAEELQAMAGWLGLAQGVRVEPAGDLAGPLAVAVAAVS